MGQATTDSGPWTGRRVAVSGAGGLVGKSLCGRLQSQGAAVLALTRDSQAGAAAAVSWDPARGVLEPSRLEGVYGVVHLAGESIAEGRWTAAKKQRIRDSRVLGTRHLCQSLAALDHKPEVLVCASAIGFYGDRGTELLTEASAAGVGFLPDVCQGWEQACDPARQAGIRVVNVRIGVILSRDGGALAAMLFPFRMGVGGKIGSGEQYMSWVALDDVVGAILTGLTNAELSGPVNATAPNPVTNAEFTRTLGSVLHRPTFLPLPGFAARLALGQMADDLLLASARVEPRRLQQLGYEFCHTDLRTCLEAALA